MRLASRAAGTADLSSSLRSRRDDLRGLSRDRRAPCCIQRLLQAIFFTPISSLASDGNRYATILQAVLNRNGESEELLFGRDNCPSDVSRGSHSAMMDAGPLKDYCSRVVWGLIEPRCAVSRQETGRTAGEKQQTYGGSEFDGIGRTDAVQHSGQQPHDHGSTRYAGSHPEECQGQTATDNHFQYICSLCPHGHTQSNLDRAQYDHVGQQAV
jgi:hypothetical protein